MSIYTNTLTGGSSNHETTSETANQVQTDFVAEGVVGAITNTSGVAPATGALAVNAQGSPNMTVAVTAGVAYVTATPSGQASQALRVYNNASANVTIAANSSGSTKYDWVYLSVSAANAANPNSAGDNVTTLTTSRSSSASADDGTPPTYGYPLAVVTVANAASSITNGNITDIRTRSGAVSGDATILPYQFVGQTADSSTTWAWRSWTPTYVNITVGNGTVVAKYRQIGKNIEFRYKLTFGSTTSISTAPTVTLPVTAASDATGFFVGDGAQTVGASGVSQGGTVYILTTTTMRPVSINTNGVYIDITATSPFSFTTTDSIQMSGKYEAA